MSESFQYVRESFMRELSEYRSMARTNNRRQDESAWAQQLDFWLDSAVFWIVRLQISDEEENSPNYGEALNKERECLDRLQIMLG